MRPTITDREDPELAWVEIDGIDYLAEQTPLECVECGRESEQGYLLLDGGEEYCADCCDVEDAEPEASHE
jgi:hypothetical protein